MPILSTSVKEVHASRIDINAKPENVKPGPINNIINIKDISERKIDFGNIKKALVFVYEFVSRYTLENPKDQIGGEIKVVGEILYSDDEKELANIMKSWKKDKNVEHQSMEMVLRVALNIAQVQAIILSERVLLPPPVKLPRIVSSREE